MIRSYKDSDYIEIFKWWIKADEIPPFKEMLTKETTFVYEKNDKPLVCISLYLTNCKEIAYLENFVRDPQFLGKEKDTAMRQILDYVENVAKTRGYKRLICFSYKDKVKSKYEEFGYRNTLNNLASFVKEIN